MIKKYSTLSVQRLSKINFANITQLPDLKIMWMNCVTLSNNSELINFKMHSHSFYEVHFILNGSAEWKCKSNEEHRVFGGQGILFAPGIRHRIDNIEQEMIRLTIAFAPTPGSDLAKHLSVKGVHCFDINSRIVDCIETILQDVETNDCFSKILAWNRIFEIISEVMRGVDCCQKHTEMNANTCEEDLIILKIKKYIADNMANPLTCKAVAEYCHFNEKYLSRFFASKTNQTLLAYIHGEKIKYAEKLLMDQSLTLKQISEMLGFANEYYFSNFFKRLSGYAPSTFRQLQETRERNTQ